MTAEQWTVLLATLFDGLTKLGFGAIVGSLLTLLIQNRSERQRAQLQRSWETEDRNIARKWNLADRETNEKKEQFQEHKRFVQEYFKTLLNLSAQAQLRAIGFREYTSDKLTSVYLPTLEQIAECRHHIEAFGNDQLNQQFQALAALVDSNLVPVLREPDENQDKAKNLQGVIAHATAAVMMTIDSVIIDALHCEDYK